MYIHNHDHWPIILIISLWRFINIQEFDTNWVKQYFTFFWPRGKPSDLFVFCLGSKSPPISFQHHQRNDVVHDGDDDDFIDDDADEDEDDEDDAMYIVHCTLSPLYIVQGGQG